MTRGEIETIDPRELGKRLANARKRRGLTQEQVAEHLDVSRPTVVAIEKGQRPARSREITRLAELFGRSVHHLVGRREVVTEFAPQFRVGRGCETDASSIKSAISAFQHLCEDYLTLETLRGAPLPKHYPPQYPTGNLSVRAAAEEIADAERRRLGLGDAPIADFFQVLESELGLRVFAVPLVNSRIAGMFIFTERLGGCILVNGSHPLARQRFTTAHELGHFLTDRYRAEATVTYGYDQVPRLEAFADRFAASFLMPAVGVQRHFRSMVQSRGDFTVADLVLLAHRYGVAVEAMTYRLQDLKCIGQASWTKLSSPGFQPDQARTQLGLEPPRASRIRVPERYRRLAVEAYEAAQISEGELARLLRCKRVEARETVQELTRVTDLNSEGSPVQLALDFGQSVPLAPGVRA